MSTAKTRNHLLLSPLSTLITIATITSLWRTGVAGPATNNNNNNNNNKPDLRWPNRQVNVLIDNKSLRANETRLLDSVLDLLDRRTCLRVNRLAPQTNAFAHILTPTTAPNSTHTDGTNGTNGDQDDNDTAHLLNFIYIFKSQSASWATQQPAIGLSSLGCLRRGRQSLVLTELAFDLPELVVRYHVMRSLGIENIERPDGHVKRLLNLMPLNQKIRSTDTDLRQMLSRSLAKLTSLATGFSADDGSADLVDAEMLNEPLVAQSSVLAEQAAPATRPERHLLSEADLDQIKRLYECAELRDKLPPLAPLTSPPTAQPAGNETRSAKLVGDDSEQRLQHATRLLSGDIVSGQVPTPTPTPTPTTTAPTRPTGTCALGDRCANEPPLDLNGHSVVQERPMLLKLDDFHAQDPLMRQANQMKLSHLNKDNLATYRLMTKQAPAGFGGGNNALDYWNQMQQQNNPYGPIGPLQPQPQPQPQPQQQLPAQDVNNNNIDSNEMLISFEQANRSTHTANPIDALASSQVLKLCSCSCRTMTPGGNNQEPPTVTPPLLPPAPVPVIPVQPEQPEQPPVPRPLPQPVPSTPEIVYPPPQTVFPATMYPPTVYPPTLYPPYDQNGNGNNNNGFWPSTPPPPFGPPFTFSPTFTYAPPFGHTSDSPGSLGTIDHGQTSPGERPSGAPVPLPPPTTTTTTTSAPETGAPDHSEASTESPTTTIAPATTETIETTTTPGDDDSVTRVTQPTDGPMGNGDSCAAIEWVKPNKTVYSSARIVWDVDRANQNYFLCQALMDNGELVPGKTHGFSCRISSEGRSYELHQFNVLTKPEHVNLAWIERSSGSFGKQYLPVFGGHSRASNLTLPAALDGGDNSASSNTTKKYSLNTEPYIVSRCLVRDENNDVITLIGYVNNQGVGLFPFDDIQIECAQYDVLACVS